MSVQLINIASAMTTSLSGNTATVDIDKCKQLLIARVTAAVADKFHGYEIDASKIEGLFKTEGLFKREGLRMANIMLWHSLDIDATVEEEEDEAPGFPADATATQEPASKGIVKLAIKDSLLTQDSDTLSDDNSIHTQDDGSTHTQVLLKFNNKITHLQNFNAKVRGSTGVTKVLLYIVKFLMYFPLILAIPAIIASCFNVSAKITELNTVATHEELKKENSAEDLKQ